MSEISPEPSTETWSPVATRLLGLVAGGQATSRTELAQQLGVAASTVSATVTALITHGLLAEEGVQSSTGGRPRKVLRVGAQDEFAVAADVGAQHVRIGVVRSDGRCETVRTVAFDVGTGPQAGLTRLTDQLQDLAEQTPGTLRAVGLALPGPVNITTGVVDRPSRMPGWNQVPVRDRLQAGFAVPVVIDNDANAMAIGEYAARRGEYGRPEATTRGPHAIVVKAGSAIGAGILIDGRIYRGATGAAGDITHVRVDEAGERPCSCGNTGCLETVASGAALATLLQDQGVSVVSSADVVRLAADGHPLATTAIRRAGSLLGGVLSANVNFFNPDLVILGGSLSQAEPFVAAVRSKLYDSCHPIITQQLRVERTRLGADAGLAGAGVRALQQAWASTVEQIVPVPAAAPARKKSSRV